MSLREFIDLLISWFVISFCFSFTFDFNRLIFLFPISLLTAGLGFLIHELSHKFVALRFGFYAGYKLWFWGLVLALVTSLVSFGRFVFVAPGAVYIFYSGYDWFKFRRGELFISLSGPLANIVLALVFYFISCFGGLVGFIGYMGF